MDRRRLRHLLTGSAPEPAPVSLRGRCEASLSLGRQLAVVDWIVVIYAIWVGALTVWNAEAIAEWPGLVLAHVVIVWFVLALRGGPRGKAARSRTGG